jgi:hypothetical protein
MTAITLLRYRGIGAVEPMNRDYESRELKFQ